MVSWGNDKGQNLSLQNNVLEFLVPLKPVAIRIVGNVHGNNTGPLSELHYPIDTLTRKPRGFAFVTFMFPEHAVKAYVAVDGQVFQVRWLVGTESLSLATEKATPGGCMSRRTSTFWVPGPMVASHVVTSRDQGHCGRALALWETQLVQEVRRFLIDNGVSLDSFSQAAEKQRKTVILAKNLPAGTLAAELQETFGRFGSLGCVLLCEGGVTVIMEFLEPLEARKAFRHLAYSKFHHVPLYLEWAPVGIFSSTAPQGKEPKKHLRERTWWSQKPART
ncbi:Hypothetical predicted protein, partial [Marmota monax]